MEDVLALDFRVYGSTLVLHFFADVGRPLWENFQAHVRVKLSQALHSTLART
jgi:hypothetical protein